MSPILIASPCKQRNCPSKAIRGLGYCQAHRHLIPPPVRKKDTETGRETPAARGYDKRWGRLRAAFLRQYPLCYDCQVIGHIRPAVLVHHIVSIRNGGDRLDKNNLISLCRECHARRHRGGGLNCLEGG
jgi:5-methylcytosine-specific restriction enzyme A